MVSGEVAADGAPLLELRDLGVTILDADGDIFPVRQVSLKIARGERVAILGESGSGKTMTALGIMGLQPAYAKIAGSLAFEGTEVALSDRQRHAALVRREAAIVFQDSLSALNPIARIGKQLVEVLTLRGWNRSRAWEESRQMLEHVGLSDAAARMTAYPHQLSGGMRQRVMLAMALLAKPSLLIADEPTTALDMTVQAQIIRLILRLQAENDMGLLLITHDLAMAVQTCSRAVIMYGGYIVEDVTVEILLRAPSHPYSAALLNAMPTLDTPRDRLLQAIDGEPPSARAVFDSCPFAPRCPSADALCLGGVPPLRELAPGHRVRCVHPLGGYSTAA